MKVLNPCVFVLLESSRLWLPTHELSRLASCRQMVVPVRNSKLSSVSVESLSPCMPALCGERGVSKSQNSPLPIKIQIWLGQIIQSDHKALVQTAQGDHVRVVPIRQEKRNLKTFPLSGPEMGAGEEEGERERRERGNGERQKGRGGGGEKGKMRSVLAPCSLGDKVWGRVKGGLVSWLSEPNPGK